ncbi:MAG TPA: hypothetical protein VEV82_11360, partial [Actinomycetota bacterium]|nr:hypothetical protein [Actinomycetota bacterium]
LSGFRLMPQTDPVSLLPHLSETLNRTHDPTAGDVDVDGGRGNLTNFEARYGFGPMVRIAWQ